MPKIKDFAAHLKRHEDNTIEEEKTGSNIPKLACKYVGIED